MAETEVHEDQKYVEALLRNNSHLLREIYERFSGKVVSFVQNNSGTEADARDVIQESLIVIYQQAFEKKLRLTCPFDAYFFLICKRKWINKLKNSHYKKVTIEDDLTSMAEGYENAVETERYEFKNKLLEDKLMELGEKCREIITLSLTIKSMETLAVKMNVTYGYLRKKKSLCMKQLTGLIHSSKGYKEMNKD